MDYLAFFSLARENLFPDEIVGDWVLFLYMSDHNEAI